MEHQTNLVPIDLHLKLATFTAAHKRMIRYFEGVEVKFIGDITAEEYDKITDILYEIDQSQAAANLIAESKQAFAIYSYSRSLIQF
jgi:hypothetical protein